MTFLASESGSFLAGCYVLWAWLNSLAAFAVWSTANAYFVAAGMTEAG